jgi:protocatechuate 3,4-dioxygenase beta subunit
MSIHDEPDNADVSVQLLSRRKLLALSGVAGAGVLGLAGSSALTDSASASTASDSVSAAEAASACKLTSEAIEGPYYLDGMLRRRNIVEDRTGVPLNLQLRVIDSIRCKPIRNAAVEIWHCDGSGVYSGYTDLGSGGGGGGPIPTGTPTGPPPGGGGGHVTPTDDLTFLRGLQVTDRNGRVSFRSIVPGWYTGRAVHIHTKVHTEGKATATGYIGGHTCHTGQLYFAEKLVTLLNGYAPYSTNTTTRVLLDQDFLYPGTGSPGGLLALSYQRRHLERGVTGRLTVSVDPAATNDGAGGPGGPVPTGSPSPT